MLASVAMMFDYSLGMKEVAESIEQAIHTCICNGDCTTDLGGTLTTNEAGEAVCRTWLEADSSRAANV
jgi:3-isopropylmalate dehydrogenase